MKYDFDTVIDRRGTWSMKWESQIFFKRWNIDVIQDENTIVMNTADMDFRCAQPMIDALHKVVDHQIFGYTMTDSDSRYKDAVINWYKRHYDWELKPEEIFYSNGSVEVINAAVRAFSDPGDGVIVCPPVYGHFSSAMTEEIDPPRTPVYSHLKFDENGRYVMDYEDIERKCRVPENKVLIICSPHNPVGRVWEVEEIRKLAKICGENGVLLISDEVHCDILRPGQVHHPTAQVAGDLCEIVTVSAINKSFNAAGLLCANGIIKNPWVRARVEEKLGMRNPTPFAVAALIACYNEGEDWLKQVNEYIDGNFDWVIDFLKKEMPLVKVQYPEGTYVLWLDFSAYGFSQQKIHDLILKDANVLMDDGIGHDPIDGGQYMRAIIACPRSLVKEAFTRVAKVFKDEVEKGK